MQHIRKLYLPLLIASAATFLLFSLLQPATSQAQDKASQKISAELRDALANSDGESVDVIIRLGKQPKLDFDRLPQNKVARRQAMIDSLQRTAESSQGDLLDLLERLKANESVRSYQSFWIFNGVAAEVSAEVLTEIAQLPEVASITIDRKFEATQPIEDHGEFLGDAHPDTWGLDHIRAPQAWHAYGITGTGVTVAIMDSGVEYLHPALAENYRGLNEDGSYTHEGNFYSGANPTRTVPYDVYGHGTHVAGTAVGREGIGVAPGANWIAVAIADDDKFFADTYIYTSFEWLLAPGGDPANAPDIVNGSWGGPGGAKIFINEIELLKEAGIVPVFSAGNNGPFTVTMGAPSSYSEMVSVGALDFRGDVAFYSSRGPSPLHSEPAAPLIAAPGSKVYSSYLDNTYKKFSGTSMAAPHTSGALALLLSTDHNLTDYSSIREHLINSAVPFQDSHPNYESGYGRLDALELIDDFTDGITKFAGVVQSNGEPIPNAEILISNSTGSFSIVSDETGQYSFSGKPGVYSMSIPDHFGYADYDSGSLYLSSGTIFNISLQRNPFGILEGQVVDESGDPLTSTIKITTLDQEFSFETDSQGYYSAEFPAGFYSIEVIRSGYTMGKANAWVYVDQTATNQFELAETESILFIDAGQWSYRDRAADYADMFSELELGYDVAEILHPVDDIPTVDTLTQYDVVIWSDPKYSPGYVSASDVISDYMSAGGNMLVTGNRIAYYDYLNLFEYEWITQVAHAKPRAIITPTKAVYGREGSLFEGVEADITVPAPGEEFYGTLMAKQFTYQGDLIISHGNVHEEENAMGMKTGHCDGYNMIYLGFDLSDIVDQNDQAEMLQKSLSWLTREPIDGGVRWMAEDSNSPVAQGEKYSYTFPLQNQSEVYTTTFDIIVDTNWPTEVVSPTITLGPCEVVELTYTVTVPSDLGKNVYNDTVIRAEDITNPAESDMITMSHKTPATVLLVDDHRWYTQNELYESVLQELGIDYDMWMTRGTDMRGSPGQALLDRYPYIVWYTAYDWFAPLTDQEVESLENYLDQGGRLFLNSQDFLYYNDETELARSYFGVIDYHESITPTAVYGDSFFTPADNITGSMRLEFDDFQNGGDSIILADRQNVTPLVWHDRGIGGVGSSSTDPEEPWRSVFWSVPFEKVSTEQTTQMMADVIGWLGDLGESKIEVDQRFVMPGETQTFTVTLKNRPTGETQAVTVTNRLPDNFDYVPDSLTGPATYDSAEDRFVWSGVLLPGGETSFTYQAIPQTTSGYINRISIQANEELVPFGRGVFVQAGGANLSESTVEHELGPMIDGERQITLTLNLNNVGNTLVQNITATAFVPSQMNYLTDTISVEAGSAVFTQSEVVWTGTLAPNISIGVSATFTSSNPFIDEWVLSNIRIDEAETPRWFVYDPQFFPSKKAWFPFIGHDTGSEPPDN